MTRRRALQTARPSWISGAARLVDLGGTFDRYGLARLSSAFGEQALLRDWEKVGLRLSNAMRRVEEESK